MKRILRLPPGRFTLRYASKLDKIIARKRERMMQRAYKQQRKKLKELRSASTAGQEIREVPSYSPGIDLLPVTDDDCTEIPTACAKPAYIPLSSVSKNRIFWDLETTGLGKIDNWLKISHYLG